jgi:hypothetical protein
LDHPTDRVLTHATIQFSHDCPAKAAHGSLVFGQLLRASLSPGDRLSIYIQAGSRCSPIESDGGGGFEAKRKKARRRERLESVSVHGEFRQSNAWPTGCRQEARKSFTSVNLETATRVHGQSPGRMNEARKGISHRFLRTGSHPFEMRIEKPASRGAALVRCRVTSQSLPSPTCWFFACLLTCQPAVNAPGGTRRGINAVTGTVIVATASQHPAVGPTAHQGRQKASTSPSKREKDQLWSSRGRAWQSPATSTQEALKTVIAWL